MKRPRQQTVRVACVMAGLAAALCLLTASAQPIGGVGGPASAWDHLPGRATSRPECVVSRNQIHCFAVGGDRALHHWWLEGSSWREESLGGGLTGPPECVSWPGHIECFARGDDRALWRRSWDGVSWTEWESLGGIITGDGAYGLISCTVRSDGRAADSLAREQFYFDCFVRGTDGALWRRGYDTAGGDLGWVSGGGLITTPPECLARGLAQVVCFARGTDNALWRNSAIGSGWRGWDSLNGTLTSEASCIKAYQGGISCFARGTDNALWRRSEPSASEWEQVGGAITDGIDCVGAWSGQIDCFAINSSGAVVHTAYNRRWTEWESLGGSFVQRPECLRLGLHQLHCFALTREGELLHRWRDGSMWRPITQDRPLERVPN